MKEFKVRYSSMMYVRTHLAPKSTLQLCFSQSYAFKTQLSLKTQFLLVETSFGKGFWKRDPNSSKFAKMERPSMLLAPHAKPAMLGKAATKVTRIPLNWAKAQTFTWRTSVTITRTKRLYCTCVTRERSTFKAWKFSRSHQSKNYQTFTIPKSTPSMDLLSLFTLKPELRKAFSTFLTHKQTGRRTRKVTSHWR